MFKKIATWLNPKQDFVDEAKTPTPPTEAKAVDPLDPLDAKSRHTPWPEDKLALAFVKVSEFPTFDGLAGGEVQQARVMDGAIAKSKATMDMLSGSNDSEGSLGLAMKGGGSFLGVPESLGLWYMSQGFFGYQACAIIAQHWLVDKACSMSGEDAARNGWVLSARGGDEDLSKEDHDKLLAEDKRFKIKENLVEFNRFKNVFGIRIAIFKVKSSDPLYYEKPFNLDGCGMGCYEGISQVDPYWMTPVLTSAGSSDPSTIGFYEPQYWVINGKKYHISHLAIVRGPQPADILKPTYIFGGIPLTQRIYERVYAAERTANESPLMAMSKRTMAIHADLDKVLANQCEFEERLALWIKYRDNHGVKVLGTEESMEQFDTSMTDFDSIIMNQYQLVAAIARTPATKLLGTSPKGFNATGEFESKSYHEELESIQEHVMQPMLERHYELSARSIGLQVQLDAVFNPVDSVSTKERADLNKLKSDMGVALINAGVISPEEERQRLQDDEHSGYDRLAEGQSAETEPGMSPENLAALQKAGAAETAAENPAAPNRPQPGARADVVESVPGQSPGTLAALLPLLLSGVSTDPGKPPADPTMAALLLVLAKMAGATAPANDSPTNGFSVQPSVKGSVKGGIQRGIAQDDGEVVRKMPQHKLPKMRLNGLNLVIENPRGTIRTGIDLDGVEWASQMPDHYGFIKGYMGADGQDVDCFIGPNLRAKYVFVISQKCPETGEFDEYKCMLCYDTPAHAVATYNMAYTPDWDGFDSLLEPMDWDEFKEWLESGAAAEAPVHTISMADAAEWKESDHPRAKNGQFGSGGGGGGGSSNKGGLGSEKAGGPTALNKKLGAKKDALPALAKSLHEKTGKIPSSAEFHKAATEMGFNIIQAQSDKYLKMYKPGAPAPSAQAVKAAAAAPLPPASDPKPPVAQPAQTVQADHKKESADLAKFYKKDSPTALAEWYAGAVGYPKEGVYNGIAYFKAASGQKVSYKEDTDTWMAMGPDKKVLAQGSGVKSMMEWAAKNQQPATAPASTTAPSATVHNTSTESAKTYGHSAVPYEKFTFSTKGIATESAFTSKVKEAIKVYRGSGYSTINDAMRYSAHFDPDTVSPQTMAHILNLQRAFAQVPPTQKDASVVRKIKTDALKALAKDAGVKDLKDLAPGMVFRESGVMSTSHGEIGWSGDVKLSIKIPKGSKAIDLSETINTGEQEVMLPPDSKFKITNVTNTNGKHHIECELLQHHH